MTSRAEALLIEGKIKFLRRHLDLARNAFDIQDATTCHNTDPATELTRFARKELGYSKRTAKVDIFASLLRAWNLIEVPE